MSKAMMSVADALARVLDDVVPLSAETVPLLEAHGRVLAHDLAALRTQPPADMSAMDGYAVRAADVTAAPVTLSIIGEVAAGRVFEGHVGHHQATRIFTGGVMPDGADTVVIQESTTRDGDRVTINAPVSLGKNVRRRGLDFREGQVLLPAGTRLSDRALMLAASLNHPTVPVHGRPVVALLGTGDELVMPGSQPGPGEIIYSNGYSIAALARAQGATVLDLGIARDRHEDIAGAVRRARDERADVLVTTGGASVGDYDLVQQALASEGLDLAFWKIAMRPGRPMMNGRLGAMRVLGLPGNPVSAYVCAFLFLGPLLRALSGHTDAEPREETARLGCDLAANDERADYLRAALAGDIATPVSVQDSSMTATLSKADCLLIREPFAPAAAAGSPCRIIKLGV